ncbi:hypothetical protein PMI09_00787 [Rhizobium sp. CF122]|nr:hypothetical protein PMI09_00787 [Rhizobium sp. CF122]
MRGMAGSELAALPPHRFASEAFLPAGEKRQIITATSIRVRL